MNSTLDYFVKKFDVNLEKPSPMYVNYSRFRIIDDIRTLGFVTGVEIGTEHGSYASRICNANPQLKLYCVDPYTSIPYYADYKSQEEVDVHYEAAKNKLRKFNCEIIKTTSMEAVKRFQYETIDFVFIDGDHRFEFVVNDVIYWSRIVRPGGIVYGHDYSDQFHVKQAINGYMDAYKIKNWFVMHKTGLVDSWMFVREETDKIWQS